MTITARILPLAAAAALLAAAPASAQDSAWSFRFTPYVWLPSVSGDAEAGGGLPSVGFSSGISDVLHSLNFAAMGTFEARNGRWGLLADAIYLDLRTDADAPAGILFDRAKGSLSGLVFSGYGGYTVLETDRVSLELLLGFRVFALDFEATFFPAGPFPAFSRGASETWVNPLVGARVNVFFTDRFFGGLSADVGGWDGDLTWQAIGVLGYRFDDAWDVRAGYRYMAVQHDFGGGVSLDAAFHGPIIGFGYSF